MAAGDVEAALTVGAMVPEESGCRRPRVIVAVKSPAAANELSSVNVATTFVKVARRTTRSVVPVAWKAASDTVARRRRRRCCRRSR